MPGLSHQYLTDVAFEWLKDYRECLCVSQELGNWREIPDAIGFKFNNSILVEVKVSRSDFFADRHKYVRKNPKYGMGRERWYLTPKGMVKPEEVPDGWGLIEHRFSCHDRGFYLKELVKAKRRPLGREAFRKENELLIKIAWFAAEANGAIAKVGFAQPIIFEREYENHENIRTVVRRRTLLETG